MYNTEKDTYTCDICGVEIKWDSTDDQNGIMWGCEKCDTNFCTKCFVEQHGWEEYCEMLQESDQVLCPVCWEKRNKKKATVRDKIVPFSSVAG